LERVPEKAKLFIPWINMGLTNSIGAGFYGGFARPVGFTDGVIPPPPLSNGRGIAIAHNTSPFITAYPWSNAGGFGSKYANPGIALAGNGLSVDYTDTASDIFIGHSITPFISAYPWSIATGFGTKYANPGTLPGAQVQDVECRSSALSTDHHVACAVNGGTSQAVYHFSKTGGGFGTKFSNPGVALPSAAGGVDFTTGLDDIIFGCTTTPFVQAYPWSDAGYGTKYANPAILPPFNCSSPRFSASDGAIASAHSTGGIATTVASAWGWSGAGFGSKYTDPVYPVGYPGVSLVVGVGARFTHANNAFIHGAGFAAVFGSLFAWDWTDVGGFGTRYTLNFPYVLNASGVADSEWNESDTTIFIGRTVTPLIEARPWTAGSGLQTPYSDPAIPPGGTTQDVAVAI
jgi:hypothetical protein